MSFHPSELNALADLEHLAQRCTQAIAPCLEPGMTEEMAASLLRQWLRQHGVHHALHRPLAWFGERGVGTFSRSALPSLRPGYFPTATRLQQGQNFVLYCAPMRDGHVAESFHCASQGTHPTQQQLMLMTSHLKTLLLRAINQQQTLGDLTQLISQLVAAQGAQLAEQGPCRNWIRPYSQQPDMGCNFSGMMERVVELTGNLAPAYLPTSDLALPSNQPLTPGLWVIQPWLSKEQAGAGFRSLLYISDSGAANWLTPSLAQTQAA